MRRGIYPGISSEEYHGDRTTISKSGLSLLAKSPYHFRNYESNERTKAMIYGSAYHTAILEPSLFDKEFAVAPQCDRRTKAGKELWEQFQRENEGKQILAADDYENIMRMREVMFLNQTASDLIRGCVAESSVFWTDSSTNIECKCRPDIINASGSALGDLKTTDDVTPQAFAATSRRYRYDLQAAFYLDGYNEVAPVTADRFIFIAQEKTHPYAVACYEISPFSIEHARNMYRDLLQSLKDCRDNDYWPMPGEYEGITTIQV